MKLRNSTDWPDWFVRRCLSWCCRKLGFPVRSLREAQFRNRTNAEYSGHAYGSMRIVCSVGPETLFPCREDRRAGMDGEILADRIEALVAIIAHEVRHLVQYRERRSVTLRKDNLVERDARWHSMETLRAFREKRAELLAEWNEPPAERPSCPVVPIQEKRAAKVANDLARWQRKAKLAATKIKKLKQRLRYYERVAASRAG